MPTVYVTNRGGHDYQDAKRFGSLEFLSEGQTSPFAVNKAYREFAAKLRTSTPNDYLLLTGLTIMNVIAASCFSFLHNGRLNLLLFRNGRYVERTLQVGELLRTDTMEQMQKTVEED